MKTRISPSWVLGLVLLASVPTLLAQDALKSSSAVSAGRTSLTNQTAPYQSPWFTELGKLAQAGIEEQVMLAFVDAAGTFNLRPEQIIHLRDLGVSSGIINAILQHDSEIALGLRQVPASTTPDSSSALEKLLIANNQRADVAAPRPGADTFSKPVVAAASPSSVSAASPVAPANAAPPIPLEVAPVDVEEMAQAPTFVEAAQTTTAPKELSPVRKPYPEQLTNPIIVVRAAGRIPNLVIIEGFADSTGR